MATMNFLKMIKIEKMKMELNLQTRYYYNLILINLKYQLIHIDHEVI